MPLYEYRCTRCNGGTLEMRKIEERHDAPECWTCKRPMRLRVTPVAGVVKNPAVPRSPK